MVTKADAESAIAHLTPIYFGEDTDSIGDIIESQSFRLIQDYGDSLVLVEDLRGRQYVLGGDANRQYVIAVCLRKGWRSVTAGSICRTEGEQDIC